MIIDPILLIHGGAGNIPDSAVPKKLEIIRSIVIKGYKNLLETNSVLDAVEFTVRLMEDDENFNAGKGSVLNLDGEIEMDATIMDGRDLNCGALGNVKNIKNPISLARRIMEKTPHVLLCGDGAHKFAKEQGFEFVEENNLKTQAAIQALDKYKKNELAQGETEISLHSGTPGTVGAVAIDKNGNIAVATSTGGMNGKMVGRVGDTAIIGSGTYADNHIGGCSTTGNGDAIIKTSLAHAIIKNIENGLSAQIATELSLNRMSERLKKEAGAITISKTGDVGVYFTSQKMSWAYIKKNQLHYGCYKDQHEIETTHI